MNSDDYQHRRRSNSEEDGLDELQKRLYSRDEAGLPLSRSTGRLKRHDLSVPRDWGGGLPEQSYSGEDPVARVSLLKKLLLGSAAFFVLCLGVALYVFFGGANVISSSNVDIQISGPVSVAGGEVLSLDVRVVNQNNADLDSADLIVDYPDGTRQPNDMAVPLKRYRESLGVIAKGGSVERKIQAVLFGQEGDTKNINISVEYRVKGSNAIFPKEKTYTVTINSSPVTVTVDADKQINSGQPVNFTVNVASNASTVIKNLALSAEYPFGFTFGQSDPAPTWSNSFWQLGDLPPGGSRAIKISGVLVGQDNDQRTFNFSVGTPDPSNENTIGTAFLTASNQITIQKPSISASLALNGDTSDNTSAVAGSNVRGDLTLSNNAGLKITNVKVSVKLSGNAFDQGSIVPGMGFYSSSDKTIVWDQTLTPGLAVLNPDGSVPLSFSFSVLPENTLNASTNPDMNLIVTVTGSLSNQDGSSQDVTSTITKDIRVPTNLHLTAQSLYYSGAFKNTGPIPPKADKPTTYTIVWSLTNGWNDLSNVKVTATLPSYVTWLGVVSPSSEKISYNPIGGVIEWDPGDISAGTGFVESPRAVSFQVSLTPSQSQVQSSPMLVSAAAASGDDAFANQTVQTITKGSLTTDLPTDVNWTPGQGMVTQ